MRDHLGGHEAARLIEKALERTIALATINDCAAVHGTTVDSGHNAAAGRRTTVGLAGLVRGAGCDLSPSATSGIALSNARARALGLGCIANIGLTQSARTVGGRWAICVCLTLRAHGCCGVAEHTLGSALLVRGAFRPAGIINAVLN